MKYLLSTLALLLSNIVLIYACPRRCIVPLLQPFAKSVCD